MKKFTGMLSISAIALGCTVAAAQEVPRNDIVQDRLSPGDSAEIGGGDEARGNARPDVRRERGVNSRRAVDMNRTIDTDRQVRNQSNDPRDRQAQSDAANQRVERFFAAKLMMLNESVIELSEMAKDKSTNEQVQEFAKSLENGHSELNERLEEFSPRAAQLAQINSQPQQRTAGFRGIPEQTDSDTEQLADIDQDNRNNKRVINRANNPLRKILNVEAQASQNYLKSSQNMLERYSGQDFDMGYLGFQIGTHTWAIAELNAMSSVGDEQFQAIVKDTVTKLESHLQKAQELSNRLEANEEYRTGLDQETINRKTTARTFE